MGWYRDTAPGHEGYLIGIEKIDDTHRWRELGNQYDRERAWREKGIKLTHVQVACECGWRSPRFLAPLGTEWHPSTVELPGWDERTEEQAAGIWGKHADECAGVEVDCLLLRAPLRATGGR